MSKEELESLQIEKLTELFKKTLKQHSFLFSSRTIRVLLLKEDQVKNKFIEFFYFFVEEFKKENSSSTTTTRRGIH